MNKELSHIISVLVEPKVIGSTEKVISQITLDSREAIANTLFVAIKGSITDGHLYIKKAIEQGCNAIVCEDLPSDLSNDVCYIQVNNSSRALAIVANYFFDYPSRKLKVVAVTGTNGKTTVSTLLFNLFKSFGHSCGLISTVQNQIDEKVLPATHTTPNAVAINKLLFQMQEESCEYVFMEASSHAIDQDRIFGIHFNGVLFTNITRDHLDYHITFDNYIKAKKKLFDEVNSDAFALTNKDDKNGLVMLQNCNATKYSYGLYSMADFKGKIIEHDFDGMLLQLDGEEAWFNTIGEFNAYNLLLVYGTAFLLGKEKHEIITHLSKVSGARGRFEIIKSKTGIISIIDYAHTPDALENVLNTINKIRTKNEKLITIVGCGGNRDKGKRPQMADIASKLSDMAIFTSDNPRDEDPDVIIDEMQKGVQPLHYKKTHRIANREESIKMAVSLANKGDIILVAGKGHETYQEIKGIKHPFDDKIVVINSYQLMEK